MNFVVLLTKQLVCTLPNFISKSSSFLWFGCLQRAEWMEDRWGGEPWGTPECCSSGSGADSGIYCKQPVPEWRVLPRAEAAWLWPVPVSALWRKLLPSAAGQCVPAVSLPCSGTVALGEGSLLRAMADPLCVSQRWSCCPHQTCGSGRCWRSASRTAVWLLKTI